MLTFRKKVLFFLALLLFVSTITITVFAETTTNQEDLPAPLYHWGFEPDEVDGSTILNKVNSEETTDQAELKEEATVLESEEKGNVLHLPGNGWLELPGDIYEEVTDELTISVWVNIEEEASGYSRLVGSTITEKHQHYQGVSGSWSDPEFAFVAGGANYNQIINIGTDTEGAADYRAAVSWEDQPDRNSWQHVAISLKSDGSYRAYIDGQSIGMSGMDGNASDDDANLEEAVQQFFDREFLDALQFNDFGRSIYTSDDDVTGYFDDLQIYNQALTSDQVLALVGPENDATINSITVGDDVVEVDDQKNIRYEISDNSQVDSTDISVETSNPNANVEIEKINLFTYEIRVTSTNNLKTLTYTLSLYNPDLGAIANFDMNKTNGEIMHGASGFLYGVSEPNVPTIDLLEPLKPQVVEQKPPNGLQHPTGDGLRVADTYFEAGTEWIQLAVPDMYLQWPYEYEGLDHYEELIRETVRTVKDNRNSDKIVYVIFNEPNGIWFSGNLGEDGFLNAWERMYNVVKEEDSDAKIAGPNLSHYDSNFYEDFVEFAVENNVLPDQFTWHELSGESSLSNWDAHFDHYRSLEEEYGFSRPVVINEYSNPEDPGAAGSMIQWLSRIENSKVNAGLAYWHFANTLNELAADANRPNGAWWLYKWYGDMTGQTVDVETYNAEVDGMYGLTSIDEGKGKAYTIFGGEDGVLTASMENLTDTSAFHDAQSVHVKLYRTKYTGFLGTHEKPRVEFEGNVPLQDGNLNITIRDANELDGYHAIVTPATNDTTTDFQDYNRIWTKKYEAEDAQLNGASVANQGWGAVSNQAYVQGLNSSEKNVKLDVTVPQDGKYKLEVFYGNGAPLTDGKNRAQGELARQLLTLNGEEYKTLTYDSTVDSDVFSSETVYLDLEEGTHSLQFSYESGMEASLDKFDLTYVGEKDQDLTKTYLFEAEEASYSDGFTLKSEKDNYSSAGYITGSGENQYTVVVEDNGYYDLELGYASDSKQSISVQKRIVNYPENATAEAKLSTEWNEIAKQDIETSEDITSVSGSKIYLTAGANSIILASQEEVSLDYLKVTHLPEETSSNSTIVEAEDGDVFGEAKIIENKNTSGEQVVSNIGENKNNGLSFDVEVEEAGAYKLSIDYINDEPAPVIYNEDHPDGYLHPYNTDLVERYAQIVVNEQSPQTVYFRNTLSWDTVKNHVVDVTLKAGKNTITLYNDNSYQFNDVVQYAPHFDKFEIAKSTLSDESEEVTNIHITPEDLLLKKGKEMTLEVTAEYEDGNTVDVTEEAEYHSKNEEIVTVTDKGEVLSVGTGETEIQIKYQSHTKVINVKVYQTTITLGEAIEVIAGELFNINNSNATIHMPEDLPKGTTLTVYKVDQDDVSNEGYIIAGDVYEYIFEYPSGNYSESFTLTLEYDQEKFKEKEVDVHYQGEDSDEWEIRDSKADQGVISFTTNSFSTYGVFAEEERSNDGENSDDNADEDNNSGSDNQDQGNTNQVNESESDQGETTSEESLPDTATSMFNWLLVGLALLVLGIVIYFIVNRRKNSN
ncbi:LamG-like jellyroll fold domain-containing protein [Gracilibacillus kekensis]|uniref:LPXTG-motif cell wall anchor domain-containing protein n=1 Tax=Gracilibacillus kekensis TaxID=1027249 RepID=A0A1M7JVN4_9BACI|nr:LamG-like jellyroll fold domain-containing protein [Gracilibacillus kekensis]SHM57099.1 LPXTG-motif cell wall anchor domain-containing protein [Gracilibacillus kekensis]